MIRIIKLSVLLATSVLLSFSATASENNMFQPLVDSLEKEKEISKADISVWGTKTFSKYKESVSMSVKVTLEVPYELAKNSCYAKSILGRIACNFGNTEELDKLIVITEATRFFILNYNSTYSVPFEKISKACKKAMANTDMK